MPPQEVLPSHDAVETAVPHRIRLVFVNILASRNRNSGVVKPTFRIRKPLMIGLTAIHKKLSQWQAQSRFAGRT